MNDSQTTGLSNISNSSQQSICDFETPSVQNDFGTQDNVAILTWPRILELTLGTMGRMQDNADRATWGFLVAKIANNVETIKVLGIMT